MSGPVITIGTVLSVDHRERSIVSGYGGGGGVTTLADGRVVGMQNPVSISTRTESKDVIWIRTGAGKEINFKINDESFACRESHKVGFLHDDYRIYAIHNFATEQTVRYYTNDIIKGLFAVPSVTYGFEVAIGLICTAIGAGGVYIVSQDKTIDRSALWIGLFLLVPMILAFVIDRRIEEHGRKQDDALVKAKGFVDYLGQLEAEMITD